jgi:hypothetical protein
MASTASSPSLEIDISSPQRNPLLFNKKSFTKAQKRRTAPGKKEEWQIGFENAGNKANSWKFLLIISVQ